MCVYVSVSRSKPELALTYSDEILVTKSELEEQTSKISELEGKVNDLQIHNQYQLRMKDVNSQEKMKELSDRFQTDISMKKQQLRALQEQKQEMEMDYEEKVKKREEEYHQKVTELQNAHNTKLMEEMKRYQKLEAEMKAASDAWQTHMADAEALHQQRKVALQTDYGAKLEEQRVLRGNLDDQKQRLLREFEETKTQMEEDADKEIEELKERYEGLLQRQREDSLKLKSEIGFSKKRANTLNKDTEDLKEELKSMDEKKKQLDRHIEDLKAEIESQVQESRERDAVIWDTEQRIYQLKKRNQELEKWKFVLDYRIKDLKQQIEPREEKIKTMRKSIQNKDGQLEEFHQNNAKLRLVIEEYKKKKNEVQDEINRLRHHHQQLEQKMNRFCQDLHKVVQHIQQPEVLVRAVNALYEDVTSGSPSASATLPSPTATATAAATANRATDGDMEVEGELQKEYARQRTFLQRTTNMLNAKLAKESQTQRHENMRMMQENVALLKEINDLRKEIKLIRQQQRQRELTGSADGTSSARRGNSRGRTSGSDQDPDEMAASQELQRQRDIIRQLRQQIDSLQNVRLRPISREQLPPIQ